MCRHVSCLVLCYDLTMKAKMYVLEFRGKLQLPVTARKIAGAMNLPLSVVTKRLQRGERVVERLMRPVGVYGGNDGHRASTWHDRREAMRHESAADRDEQRRIARAEAELTWE